MSASVEDRLRAALAQQAETTTTAPDGWSRIKARLDRRRRPAFLRWTLLAPAAVVATVVVLVITALAGEPDRTVRVTGGPSPAHMVPDGVGRRFHLIEGNAAPRGDPLPPWTYRAFGRRAADGVALAASVIITTPGDRARNGATPEPAPLRVLGRDLTVVTDPLGQRNVRWTQPDGRDVGVLTFGLTQDEFVAVVESLLRGDAATAAPSLPAGFAPLGEGSMPGAVSATSDIWHVNDGASLMVTVAEGPDETAERLALWMPGGRATQVRGKTAILLAARETYLTWSERPGATVTLQARNIAEADLIGIANALRPMTDAQWQALVGGGPERPPMVPPLFPDIGPPPGVTLPKNFLILPVRARLAPPCGPLRGSTIYPERREGRELACYDVGAPFVDAGQVASVSLVDDVSTGTFSVEFTLTPEGAANFDRLFRDVGPGGQYAFVLDAKLISAPRFGDTPPGGKGVVTGLDEQTARNLAARLGR